MPSIAESDEIIGVYVVDPELRGDARGRFIETYRRSWFPAGRKMVQADALGVAWNDPSLDFDWDVTNPVVPDRDCSTRHRP
jgi:dTDP-4-dehydrorhamnose 3,5-epimerase-like enzyme